MNWRRTECVTRLGQTSCVDDRLTWLDIVPSIRFDCRCWQRFAEDPVVSQEHGGWCDSSRISHQSDDRRGLAHCNSQVSQWMKNLEPDIFHSTEPFDPQTQQHHRLQLRIWSSQPVDLGSDWNSGFSSFVEVSHERSDVVPRRRFQEQPSRSQDWRRPLPLSSCLLPRFFGSS